ncbi:hypothetical protein [Pelovirga terrestris]|uniref:Uncharacterized protein n=1 Tax=Pelovirga terrestris TaxID=2771352 RepID=A0A8J6QYK0_9BACT|nr:hypothetical protein [Pelovirga terrestris]MBD1401871.1 hypothetical protein [Pelovirga terrestris]
MTEDPSAWMCHICNYRSTSEEGIACSRCYKISCRQHFRTVPLLNPESGLYEFVRICALCELKDIS